MPSPLSGPSPLHPDRMTPAERFAEIGRILAAGILRLHGGDIRLDFPPDRSVMGREPGLTEREK